MIDTIVVRSSGLRPQVPPEGEVHLWSADLDQLAADAGILSASERSRADRLVFTEHRRRFIAARVWCRSILGSCLGLAPQDVPMVADSCGKPHIRAGTGCADLRFSVSHCENLALMGVATDCNIGVDLEAPLPGASWPRVAERFLTPEERTCIRNLSSPQRSLALAEIWTRKESLSKAQGTGLTEQVLSWTVGPACWLSRCCSGQLWVVSLHNYYPWAAAVAVERSPGDVHALVVRRD
jgi:4'-phosphopantetheinyl transferase